MNTQTGQLIAGQQGERPILPEHPRILIITHHFPPCAASGTFRLLGFARHLPAFGWNVRVLCPGQAPLEPVDHELTKKIPAGVVVDEVPYTLGPVARLRARLSLSYTFFEARGAWVKPAVRAGAEIVVKWQPDVILTSSPPHSVHLVGLELRRQFGMVWAADFRDPWMAGSWRKERRPRLQARAEQEAMSAADLIIANAPNALAAMTTAYPQRAADMMIVTNGFDPEAFPARNRTGDSKSKIRLVHIGEIYAGRSPTILLRAVHALSAVGKDVGLILAGRVPARGEEGAEWMMDPDLSGLVESLGQVSYDLACQQMADADILCLFDSPGRRIGVPAKLYEYLGAHRPILALAEPDSDTAQVLRESGTVHRIAAPQDPAAVLTALRELIDTLSPEAARGDSRRVGDFSRRAGAERLDTALRAVLAKRSEQTEQGPA